MDQAGPAQQVRLPGGQPEPAPGVLGQLRHRDRVTEREGRLEVDEVRDRGQRAVHLGRGQLDREGRLGGDHRLPGGNRVEAGEDLVRVRAQQGRQVRIELPARPCARQRPRRFDAACPVRDLGEFGELGDPGRDRHRLGFQLARPAPSVPVLVRGADRLADAGRQAELLGQCPCQPRVLCDHPVELPVPGHGELKSDPEAVQRRIARPDQPQHRQHPAHTAKLVVVLPGFQRDVVAEPLRLLMRV